MNQQPSKPPSQQISSLFNHILSSLHHTPLDSSIKENILQLQIHFGEMNKCIEQREVTIMALKQLVRYVEKKNEKSLTDSKESTLPQIEPSHSHFNSFAPPPSGPLLPQMSKSAPDLETRKMEEFPHPHAYRKRSASDADLSRQVLLPKPQFSLNRELSTSSSSFTSSGSFQESGNEFSSSDSLPTITKKRNSMGSSRILPSPLSKSEKRKAFEFPEKAPNISNVLSLCNPNDVDSNEEYYIETCFDSEDDESFIESENADEAKERFLSGEEEGKRRKPNCRLPNTTLLKRWIVDHWTHPYPSESEKEKLCVDTDLTRSQLNNWFTNARRRMLIRKGKGKPFHYGKFALPLNSSDALNKSKNDHSILKFDKENGGFPVGEKLENLFTQFLKTSPILNAQNSS